SSRHWVIHSGSSFLAESARMVSSSSPGGRLSDSISVMKPASYLRPSCAWIASLAIGASRKGATGAGDRGPEMDAVTSVAMGAAYSLLCVGEAHVDALRVGLGRGGRRWGQHLRERDPAQCIHHHVVDAPPVGAYAALAFDRAVAR